MIYSFSSNVVVLLHFIFVIFATIGGLLCIWWRKMSWLHLPAAVWAAIISFAGWVCPLTYLENWLRIKGGMTDYSEGFIIRYISPVIYPEGLTHDHQIFLGVSIVVLNLAIYGYIVKSTSKND